MISQEVLDKVDQIQNDFCKNCAVYKRNKAKCHNKANRFCIQKCWVVQKIKNVAAVTEKETRKFTPGERFYLFHHIEILGRERGVKQVASRLSASEFDIEWTYDEIKNTRQRAG